MPGVKRRLHVDSDSESTCDSDSEQVSREILTPPQRQSSDSTPPCPLRPGRVLDLNTSSMSIESYEHILTFLRARSARAEAAKDAAREARGFKAIRRALPHTKPGFGTVLAAKIMKNAALLVSCCRDHCNGTSCYLLPFLAPLFVVPYALHQRVCFHLFKFSVFNNLFMVFVPMFSGLFHCSVFSSIMTINTEFESGLLRCEYMQLTSFGKLENCFVVFACRRCSEFRSERCVEVSSLLQGGFSCQTMASGYLYSNLKE